MKNIQFNYLYRDAGNYKIHGSIIFNNPENLPLTTIENEIRKKLIDSEFFDPKTFGLPKLGFETYDEDADHSWNEFASLEETTKASNNKRTINEFLANLN